MNTFSHIAIGNYLQLILKENYGIELNLGSFVLGNLLPDMWPTYKKVPHTKTYWTDYFKSEFEKLSAHKQKSASFDRDYSRRLGIMCHFYADFFCFPHTAAYAGGSCYHMKYEWELHRKLYEYLDQMSGEDLWGSTTEDPSAAEILDGFTALQEEYNRAESSYFTDVAFTLRACVAMITAVAGNSVALQKPVLVAFVPEPVV